MVMAPIVYVFVFFHVVVDTMEVLSCAMTCKGAASDSFAIRWPTRWPMCVQFSVPVHKDILPSTRIYMIKLINILGNKNNRHSCGWTWPSIFVRDCVLHECCKENSRRISSSL